MVFSKENIMVSSTRRGKRRFGSANFLGTNALGLKYLCFFKGYHWYV
jgi:hypothetical protein